jgi:hypothetical protein
MDTVRLDLNRSLTAAEHRRVTDEEWKRLDQAGEVGDAQDCLEEGEEDAYQATIKRMHHFVRGMRADKQAPHEATIPPAAIERGQPAEITLRAKATAELLAHLAAEEQEVQRFRSRYLGGRILTASEAVTFLESLALRLFSGEDLQGWGVPFLGHDAVLVQHVEELDSGNLRKRAVIRVNPPGEVFEKEWLVPQEIEGRPVTRADLGLFLFWPARWRDASPSGTQVLPGSVLDDLRRVARHLRASYGWDREHTTWFILTGVIPPFRPIDARWLTRGGGDFRLGEIQLTIAPWVPADHVRAVYRTVQRMIGGRERQRERGPNERTLEVLRFVVARTNHGESPDWETLRTEWNDMHGEKDQFAATLIMSRAYERVRRAILHAEFDFDVLMDRPLADSQEDEG